MEYELSISILRPLDADERATVFFMRNQAVSLTKMDLSLVMLGEQAMNVFAELCDHNFITSIIKLTEPARRKHEDLQILLQYLILCQRPVCGFSGTEIMNFCDDVKNGEETIDGKEIEKVLNYLDDALQEKRQYLKKVHVPVVMYIAKEAMNQKIAPDVFRVLLDEFFESLSENDEYMAACKSGSAKRASVQLRVKIMSGIIEAAKDFGNRVPKEPITTSEDSKPVDEVTKSKRSRKKNTSSANQPE